ncbi:MAG: VTT domain-containing protein [Psychrobacillus psychrodurans]
MEQLFFDIVQNEKTFAWVYQFLIMVLVSMIPFAPIPVVATFVASNQGFLVAFLISILGTTMGSTLLFLLSKRLLRRLALKYLTNRKYLTKYLKLIKENGFSAVLLGRIVPILPSAGINLIAGISNVRLIHFVTATLLGKLPTILAFTFAGQQIATGNWYTILIIALYLIALFLIGKKIKQQWSK